MQYGKGGYNQIVGVISDNRFLQLSGSISTKRHKHRSFQTIIESLIELNLWRIDGGEIAESSDTNILFSRKIGVSRRGIPKTFSNNLRSPIALSLKINVKGSKCSSFHHFMIVNNVILSYCWKGSYLIYPYFCFRICTSFILVFIYALYFFIVM